MTQEEATAAEARAIRRIGDLLKLGAGQRARTLAELTPVECAELFHDWCFWARPGPGPAAGRLDLLADPRRTRRGQDARRRRGGREWSKTFPIVNLIGPTPTTCATSWCWANPACWRSARADERPRYARAPPAARLAERRGQSLLFSAEEPDRLRGKQHMKLWLDELAAWRRPDAFDQAMLGLRLGDKPQAVITTTPRPTKIDQAARRRQGHDRHPRLDLRQQRTSRAKAFLERIAERYEGRPIGRQELFAEIVEETPGALWTRALIERQRRRARGRAERLRRGRRRRRPAGALGRQSRRMRRSSSPARRPTGASMCWPTSPARATRRAHGRRASAPPIAAFRPTGSSPRSTMAARWSPKCLRQAEPNLPVRTVTATRGKFLRAEPVAAAYERGVVFHAGVFAKLEDQLCALTPDFDRAPPASRPTAPTRSSGRSPTCSGSTGRARRG